jgi:hypothetical protein
MFRALNAIVGGLLFTVGIFLTMFTWTADGWTVLAFVGVGLIAVDLMIEEHQEQVCRQARPLDTDHAGRAS